MGICVSEIGRIVGNGFVFFFKQKTAYEMLRSLVGSEMCIRDSPTTRAISSPGGTSSCGCSGERGRNVLVPGLRLTLSLIHI